MSTKPKFKPGDQVVIGKQKYEPLTVVGEINEFMYELEKVGEDGTYRIPIEYLSLYDPK